MSTASGTSCFNSLSCWCCCLAYTGATIGVKGVLAGTGLSGADGRGIGELTFQSQRLNETASVKAKLTPYWGEIIPLTNTKLDHLGAGTVADFDLFW